MQCWLRLRVVARLVWMPSHALEALPQRPQRSSCALCVLISCFPHFNQSHASPVLPCTGIAAVVKALNPKIQVIGVEPAGANAMCQARRAGWAGGAEG